MVEPRNIARVERVQGFEAASAYELALQVTTWLQSGGERVIIQRDYVVAATGTGESAIGGVVFACFITYTE